MRKMCGGVQKLKRLILYLRDNLHLLYLLFLPAFLICFFALESYIGPDRPYWSVRSPLDEVIPFLEVFVLPYCLWYPMLFATGLMLLLWDVPNFKRYMLFLSIGFGAALLFCLLVPNGQDLRPESFAHSNILSRLVAALYRADTNTNVFPSMHVIGSVAAAVAVWKSERLRFLRIPWLILATAICLSTVFIKQHSILDVFGGLGFCLPIYWGIYGKK